MWCSGVMMPLFCCVCDGVGWGGGMWYGGVGVGVVVFGCYDALVLLCQWWGGVGCGFGSCGVLMFFCLVVLSALGHGVKYLSSFLNG